MLTNSPNRFKHALESAPIYGCWLGLGSAYTAEIMATTGFDWLLIDGEHAPNTIVSILDQLRAIEPYPVAPLVRAVNHDPALIKQLLDIGAETLMMPMVESAAQAKAIVSAMHYAPRGMRGMASSVVRASRWGSDDKYAENASARVALVVQIESQLAVDNSDAIAAVEGVDALFIGPADLSASLEHMGHPHHPDVQAAIAKILAAAKRHNKVAGILPMDSAQVPNYAKQGFDFIATSLDVVLLRQAGIAAQQASR